MQVFVLALLCGATLWARADDAVTERLFRAGLELEESGQLDQARQNYERIVASGEGGPWLDDALLALARLDWPVESYEALGEGTAPLRGLSAARERLQTIVTEHVSGDRAAEAMWRLALVSLEPDGPFWDPDEAAAQLTTLSTVYPDSERAPDALALSAWLDHRAGRDAAAREKAFRVLAVWPRHPAIALAWETLAASAARSRTWSDALHALGRAAEAREGADAEPPRRLARLVDRFAHRLDEPETFLSYDAEFGRVETPSRVETLYALPGGDLVGRYDRGGGVRVSVAGRTSALEMPEGTSAIGVDAWGRPWFGKTGRVERPAGQALTGVGGDREIDAVVPLGARSAWVIAGRDGSVVKISVGAAAPDVEARMPDRFGAEAIAGVPGGGVWVLGDRGERILRVDADGSVVLQIDVEQALGDAEAIASDPLGHLYAIGRRPTQLLVFALDGSPLTRVVFPEDGPGSVSSPSALAVDDAGNVAVYDSRSREVTWLR
jgi:hypothetical protein